MSLQQVTASYLRGKASCSLALLSGNTQGSISIGTQPQQSQPQGVPTPPACPGEWSSPAPAAPQASRPLGWEGDKERAKGDRHHPGSGSSSQGCCCMAGLTLPWECWHQRQHRARGVEKLVTGFSQQGEDWEGLREAEFCNLHTEELS